MSRFFSEMLEEKRIFFVDFLPNEVVKKVQKNEGTAGIVPFSYLG